MTRPYIKPIILFAGKMVFAQLSIPLCKHEVSYLKYIIYMHIMLNDAVCSFVMKRKRRSAMVSFFDRQHLISIKGPQRSLMIREVSFFTPPDLAS